MKNIVLGLVTVFLAQIGFIAYTALERQSDEFVASNGIAPRTIPIAIAPVPEIEPIVSSADLDISNNDGLAAPRPVPVKAFYRDDARSPVFRRQARVRQLRDNPTTSELFEPKVITIRTSPAAKPFTQTAVPSTAQNSNPPKPTFMPERRSFASRSASVLKKPYDWLKTLASKLM